MNAQARGAPGLQARQEGGWRRTPGTGQAELVWAGLDPEFIESVRLRLLKQRTFRVAQLKELATWRPDVMADAGQREMHGSLRAAARAALIEVDAAIRRIERGTYGLCAGCGQRLSRTRLRAVPSAPLCGPCHRDLDDLIPCSERRG
jgi:RNA polymerase-binding transcription factor DksA